MHVYVGISEVLPTTDSGTEGITEVLPTIDTGIEEGIKNNTWI